MRMRWFSTSKLLSDTDVKFARMAYTWGWYSSQSSNASQMHFVSTAERAGYL